MHATPEMRAANSCTVSNIFVFNRLFSSYLKEIFSNSSTLTLNSGSSTVSVNTTTDYEKKIFTYAGSTLTGYNPTKADTIPNTQAVVDYVAYNFANVFLRQIGDGFVTVSSIEIDDFEKASHAYMLASYSPRHPPQIIIIT